MVLSTAVSTSRPAYSDDDIGRPIIGIANAWNDLVPGHTNLRQVAEHVRKGIHLGGAAVAEFGVIACCDGTAQGHAGMHFILPSRDLIANDIEVMVEAHRLDGIVLLGSCDKIVPAMLMAAARLRIPAIFLPGGPMLGGIEFDGRKSDLTTMSEGLGMLKSGRIDDATYDNLEETCGPSCGSCAFYGTGQHDVLPRGSDGHVAAGRGVGAGPSTTIACGSARPRARRSSTWSRRACPPIASYRSSRWRTRCAS